MRRTHGHLFALLALLLLGSWSCQKMDAIIDDTGIVEQPQPTPKPLEPQLALSPTVAARGDSLTAHLSGISTYFDDSTTIDLGAGVSIANQTVVSATEMELSLEVSANATEGYRSLELKSPIQELSLDEALLVQTGSLSISPVTGERGETVDIAVTVKGLTMVTGYTWIDFGDDIDVESFTLDEENPEKATARIRIASSAKSGAREVAIEHGSSRIRLPDGFTVDRGLISIIFSPNTVSQASEVAYTITGYGTHFDPENTSVDLGIGVVLKSDNPEAFIVESPTRITGSMTVCESAVVGHHNVKVSTSFEDGPPEELEAIEGFDVEEVPITVEKAYGNFSLALYRSKSMDGSEVVVSERVSAYGAIRANVSYCPVSSSGSSSSDPSCTVSFEMVYDQPVFYPPEGCDPTASSGGSASQYPPSPSFDAGAHIYFEAPDGPTIRLDKYEDEDGSIYYENSKEIPAEDVWFDTAYDVRVDGGEGETSVPAFVAEGVLITPASDFILVEPELADEPIIDRYDSFPVTWTDTNGQPGAGTFPVATMYSYLRTTDATTGLQSYIRVYPLDDGEYVFPADLISKLYPGSGFFRLQITRPGSTFTIPGSNYNSGAATALGFSGHFELR